MAVTLTDAYHGEGNGQGRVVHATKGDVEIRDGDGLVIGDGGHLIVESGLVGIGTATPASLLNVDAGTSNTELAALRVTGKTAPPTAVIQNEGRGSTLHVTGQSKDRAVVTVEHEGEALAIQTLGSIEAKGHVAAIPTDGPVTRLSDGNIGVLTHSEEGKGGFAEVKLADGAVGGRFAAKKSGAGLSTKVTLCSGDQSILAETLDGSGEVISDVRMPVDPANPGVGGLGGAALFAVAQRGNALAGETRGDAGGGAMTAGVRGIGAATGTTGGHFMSAGSGEDPSLVANGAFTGYAAWFYHTVRINGDLEQYSGDKNFLIDHPLAPTTKYLRHVCVESNDRLTVYSGNVTTNAKGEATVKLPKYFEALNTDVRYQLTVLGKFAQAIVASEVKQNRFVIRTDQPKVKVSWQVTGTRHDPWAKKNPYVAEAPKRGTARGRYLSPEAYGKPASESQDARLAAVPAEPGKKARGRRDSGRS